MSVWAVTGGHLDDYPVEDAKRFMDGFIDFVETRSPEVMSTITGSGELSDEIEEKIKEAVEDYKATFVPSGAGDGSAAALGQGTGPDEVRPDVGWDRMSSVDDEARARPEDGGSDAGASGGAATVVAGSQTEDRGDAGGRGRPETPTRPPPG